MVASETYPVIPLPYDTVPIPGRKLQIAAVNRPDIVAIIANFYSGSFTGRSKDQAASIACVPLRSPYLSSDGKKLIESASKSDKEPTVADPAHVKRDDLFDFGVMARIQSVEGTKAGEIKLILDCTTRFKLGKITSESPYLQAKCQVFKDEGKAATYGTEEWDVHMGAVDVWDPALKGAFAHLKELSRELFQIIRMSSLVARSSGMPPMLARQLEVFVARKDISEAGVLADFMGNLTQSSYEDKLRILSAVSIVKRIQITNEMLQRQISGLQGSTRIVTITNSSQGPVDQEKLRQLQKESITRQKNGLPSGFSGAMPPGMGGGQSDEDVSEVDELKKRLDDARLSPEAQKAAERELKRLQKMNPAQAEYSVIRNYLENLAEIPWTKATNDQLDAATLSRARKQLDDDHYGLEKIKKRLLEYLAVLRLKQRANSELDAQIKTISDREAASAPTEDSDAPSSDSDDTISPSRPTPPELKALQDRRMIDKSPILLLVGPPGTGKTSLAKSVATALGRKFHRISLGGVRDEAEIRGHRRTYVAAMPGLIVSGLKKVGVANPVILLDEIDKVGTSNFHGDPSAAMLEVLDPEQNHTFMDHYVNIPIDLSKVLFIATANTLDTIPPPLLDRMETIQLSGYTTLEKRHIATRHLIPKQITTNGLAVNDVTLPDDVVDKIITAYTRESGVRNLEREIGSVCRFKAVEYSDSRDANTTSSDSTQNRITSPSASATDINSYNPSVSIDDLDTILGIERFEEEIANASTPRPGVVTGLVAFASLGQGSILFIEIAEMPGSGRVQLTGKLGDVLKESVEVALTWVKSHAFELGIAASTEEDIMAKRALHVHCPAGAIPKDGPSAGLAHTVALYSLFSNRPVPPHIAMTGEVSLRGKVTPVGGIKEKLIGALRAGVKTVILPEGNRKDVRDLPTEVLEGLEICFVRHIWEGLGRVWPEEWAGRAWEESRL